MHLTKSVIQALHQVQRLNIINSITGIKPANLIGTVSNEGIANLAVFSSIVHLGSNPALIGFICRPSLEVRRDTLENIMENGFYTINHIHEQFIERAHYTSAKFPRDESEFEYCHFTEEYLFDFKAPFVKESQVKLGMKFEEKMDIKINGTMMIIGCIEHIIFPDKIIDKEGHLDLALCNDVGISGLNTYYQLTKLDSFPYARVSELPDFNG